MAKDPLALASRALAAGEEARALETLIDGWRATRATPIARLAESQSARLEPHLAPLEGKLDAFQPRWLAIAEQKRAIDLPRLLGSVMHGTKKFGVAVVDALVARGKALATWPADPRASTVIVDHLLAGGYESTSRSTYPFWSLMFEMLETHADPRIVERLAQIRYAKVFRNFSDGARRIAWFQERLDSVVATLSARARATSLSAAVAERATKLAKLIATRGPVAESALATLTVEPNLPAPKRKRAAPAPKLDPRAARKHVEAASRALHDGDDAAALHELLEAWRSTRAPQLAELVEQMSLRFKHRLPEIAEANRAATQKAWLAICADQRPHDLPRLLESITVTFGRSTDALARVEALASRPSDPRTLAGVLRQLEKPPFYTGSTKPFWRALIALCVDHHDPRAADALERLAKRYHKVLVAKYADLDSTVSWFRTQMEDAAAQLRERVPTPVALDASTLESVEKIMAALATEETLLAEILDNLDDDQPRVVYADLLQQRGDPRGEFMALQLANRDPERVAELIAHHAHVWLGPIAVVADVSACKFERGFLSEVTLLPNTPARGLEPAVGHPAWATVRVLHLDREDPPADLLRHPIMRSLDAVTVRRSGGRRWLGLRDDGTRHQWLIFGDGRKRQKYRQGSPVD